ncbi:uncharacterized protein LOC124944687 [Impatiens glandulifera]|uniref:uncharacterized protein LOC124944687 n=1 Tax=Impatiens glandulifera TaxID=253017 RepID=UPI001FB11800|nr:uncharacterized protein LOC124944687 [Impatiens glandulifera]XP_047340970.1 uncharacterized protein LOC124944687 [Impatiens glandulifera]
MLEIMEELANKDLLGNITRPSSLRLNGGLKSSLSGRSTPRGSPSSRRLQSGRTPRKEGRFGGIGIQWFRNNRVVFWLLLITLWAYAGFYVQSRWAHGDNKEDVFGFGSNSDEEQQLSESETIKRRDLIANESILLIKPGKERNESIQKSELASLVKSPGSTFVQNSKRNFKRGGHVLRGKRRGSVIKPKAKVEVESKEIEEQVEEIPKQNSTYGSLFGPFGSTEDAILGWSPEKRTGTCDRKGEFARLVWSRKFLLIFHELSMTGAPLSMMELATEFLSCGASVSAVVLSKKGGLMKELARRKIKVLDDKADASFKTAWKVDLVIAGSAVCASWIEQYLVHYPAASNHIAWWIMENRKEYFDRAKLSLNRVKMLIFLSESQTQQWLDWCTEEKVKISTQHAVVPLSVNDELAFVAGIPSSLNSPSFTTDIMLEKRKLLRNSVREEMGLKNNDVLVISLSSINPGKGQLLLLESINLFKTSSSEDHHLTKTSPKRRHRRSKLAERHHLRALLQNINLNEEIHKLNLKVLIGSVGSKSNKVPYVKEMLSYLSEHPNISNSVLWTPSTTRVASLYSAADVYVINSQGLGETFGRVTIEAMAFGLPVLGTDAGGTKEIVEINVTGLLHPVGHHQGTQVLAKNLEFLVKNSSVRQEMGRNGRNKVEKMYLKKHMYKKFAEVLHKCMRIK